MNTPLVSQVPARHRARRGASAGPERPAADVGRTLRDQSRPPAPASTHGSAVRLVWTIAAGPLGGLAGWVSLGGWWGVAGGVLVGLTCGLWLARQPSAAEREAQRRLWAELPFAIDLVAAALKAGATPDGAVRLVAQAVGGPVAARLTRVERALRQGAPPGEAWIHLGESEAARRVVRAARRSGHSGAALAGSMARVADDLRADAAFAAQARAQTAGVLVVLPLGLCFLPAFVLTGLVPVIVAVVGDVLTTAPQIAPP